MSTELVLEMYISQEMDNIYIVNLIKFVRVFIVVFLFLSRDSMSRQYLIEAYPLL